MNWIKDLLSMLAVVMGVSIVAADTPLLLGILGVALLIGGLDYRYQERYR